jgi:transglutaminase-like putative cysteine protease
VRGQNYIPENSKTRNFILYGVLLFILFFGFNRLTAEASLPERSFFIEERIIVKNLPQALHKLYIWLPYPASDNYQSIDDFRVTGPLKKSIITEPHYKNKILVFSSLKNITEDNSLEIIVSFKAKRKEYAASLGKAVSPRALSRYLKADRLVPVNGEIKNLAQKITQGKSVDLEKARAIYDYLIDELTYSKDDPKICGIGDSLLTLQHKKGICTDYHSLFISLVRSLGIPAKFEIGLRIPEDTREGKLNGYHCWAKFYLKGKGWVPVDISEADKHPEKKDYFFGHIDENRVHLTSGRDIVLAYAQDSPPLNFFVYPYAEVNGERFSNIETNISFKQEQ